MPSLPWNPGEILYLVSVHCLSGGVKTQFETPDIAFPPPPIPRFHAMWKRQCVFRAVNNICGGRCDVGSPQCGERTVMRNEAARPLP